MPFQKSPQVSGSILRTDEELVDYYLRKKVASRRIDLDVIKDIDLYKIEPWELQEKCKIGTEEQSEWYFFSHKDKKYPTGTRTNRATPMGFWKATGRDKPIYSKHNLVGMRKSLVFYMGRAPNEKRSYWMMHEYRLETNQNRTPQEEGWVLCRVFKKRVGKAIEHESPCWYDEQVPFMPELDSPKWIVPQPEMAYHHHPYYKQELEGINPGNQLQMISVYNTSGSIDQEGDQLTDWRGYPIDKFIASQLSQDNVIPKNTTTPMQPISFKFWRSKKRR